MENPFICYTAPVEGSRLVGRSDTIKKIQDFLLAGASCSLSGLRRIGKTSVAKQVKKNIELLDSQIKTCYIPLYTIRSESAFYRVLADRLFPQSNIFGNKDNPDEMYMLLCEHLYIEASTNNFRGIVVIDELDSIVQIPNANYMINSIRELINSNSDYHLTFLFVSAKSLQWLQDNTANVSTLSGICQPFSLRPFHKEIGLADLIKLANIDSPEFLDALFHISGGHPFLASALLCAYLDNKDAGPPDPDFLSEIRLQDVCANVFLDYYKNVQKFFSSWKEEKIWNALCNIVVGPYLEKPTQNVITLLNTYGVITDDSLCFSEDFHDYLKLQCRRTPIWPRISQFEITLRNIVKDVLQKRWGIHWIEEIKRQGFDKMFNEMEETMKREQKKFHTGGIYDILDYSYLGNLKDIIVNKNNWEWFKKYFGDSKPRFISLMEKICCIRNPLAHNRIELIPESVQKSAEDACKEIEDFISQYLSPENK